MVTGKFDVVLVVELKCTYPSLTHSLTHSRTVWLAGPQKIETHLSHQMEDAAPQLESSLAHQLTPEQPPTVRSNVICLTAESLVACQDLYHLHLYTYTEIPNAH